MKRLIDISALSGFKPARRLDGETPRQFQVQARAAQGETAELYLYGSIFADEVSAQSVVDALKGLNVKTIVVHLNSDGGSVFEGVAIYNILAQRSERIEVRIDALAASIASVIAMAGDEIVIARNALMMIHRASGGVIGTADDMAKMAQILVQIEDAQILPTYRDKTKLPIETLRAMIDAETWFDAETAVEKGFADRIGAQTKARAQLSPRMHYKNLPARFRNRDGASPTDIARRRMAEIAREHTDEALHDTKMR